jgi:microcystin-dependent protein
MAQAKAITANPTVKAVLEYLNTKSSSSVPTGAICFFATTAIPTGWLLCNGSQVSRTEYAALFAAIGTKFGEGDGSTTFTLPNLDDRFIEGTTDTAKVGQYLEAGLPNITGTVQVGSNPLHTANHTGAFYGTNYGTADHHGQDSRSNVPKAFGIDASKLSTYFGASATVQPMSVRLIPCIKL